MGRVIWIVLDGVGAGEAPDAACFSDAGADTLGHVRARKPGLSLPNLDALGFSRLYGGSRPALGAYGRARERSMGKDTTTGHWEMMGVVRETPFPTYPQGFPQEVIDAFSRAVGRGVLGNEPASGTKIIAQLGEAHMRTGRYIVYTSADSVFQIAAHESVIPLDELYEACQKARALLKGPHAVARVIARPFVGEPGCFVRTAGRRDFSLEPPYPMLLDALEEHGVPVWGVGKISDIFCGRGLARHLPSHSNAEGIEATLLAMKELPLGMILTNLVDFDMLYGHRRDVEGFATALEEADRGIGRVMAAMGPEDTLILCADHGCDPTYGGSDHTRELVPVCFYGAAYPADEDIGTLEGFYHLGNRAAALLGVPFQAGASI